MDNMILLTDSELVDWFINGDGFLFVIALLYSIIMFILISRLRKLNNSIEDVEKTLKDYATILESVSCRPCQLESHGFEVEILDPTGRKLEDIKKSKRYKKPEKNNIPNTTTTTNK